MPVRVDENSHTNAVAQLISQNRQVRGHRMTLLVQPEELAHPECHQDYDMLQAWLATRCSDHPTHTGQTYLLPLQISLHPYYRYVVAGPLMHYWPKRSPVTLCASCIAILPAWLLVVLAKSCKVLPRTRRSSPTEAFSSI